MEMARRESFVADLGGRSLRPVRPSGDPCHSGTPQKVPSCLPGVGDLRSQESLQSDVDYMNERAQETIKTVKERMENREDLDQDTIDTIQKVKTYQSNQEEKRLGRLLFSLTCLGDPVRVCGCAGKARNSCYAGGCQIVRHARIELF